MTDKDIMALAQKHSAYADTLPTLRGQAIVEFARDLLARQGIGVPYQGIATPALLTRGKPPEWCD